MVFHKLVTPMSDTQGTSTQTKKQNMTCPPEAPLWCLPGAVPPPIPTKELLFLLCTVYVSLCLVCTSHKWNPTVHALVGLASFPGVRCVRLIRRAVCSYIPFSLLSNISLGGYTKHDSSILTVDRGSERFRFCPLQIVLL